MASNQADLLQLLTTTHCPQLRLNECTSNRTRRHCGHCKDIATASSSMLSFPFHPRVLLFSSLICIYIFHARNVRTVNETERNKEGWDCDDRLSVCVCGSIALSLSVILRYTYFTIGSFFFMQVYRLCLIISTVELNQQQWWWEKIVIKLRKITYKNKRE